MLWIGGAGLKDAVGRRHPAAEEGGFVTRESNMEAERLGWGTSINDVWHLSLSALAPITVKNMKPTSAVLNAHVCFLDIPLLTFTNVT